MYAVVQYLLCVLLFPEEIADYDSFREYFYSRRKRIFRLMTILFVVDLAATLTRGSAYLHALGLFYYVRTALYVLLSVAAIKIKNEHFHAWFAVFETAYEVALILKYYMTVG
jgi:hypothetical protein